jgi:hypothetical protein
MGIGNVLRHPDLGVPAAEIEADEAAELDRRIGALQPVDPIVLDIVACGPDAKARSELEDSAGDRRSPSWPARWASPEGSAGSTKYGQSAHARAQLCRKPQIYWRPLGRGNRRGKTET